MPTWAWSISDTVNCSHSTGFKDDEPVQCGALWCRPWVALLAMFNTMLIHTQLDTFSQLRRLQLPGFAVIETRAKQRR
jgi:hypothetical protein